MLTDEEIGDFVTLLKTLGDTSLDKEKRVEKIMSILERDDGKPAHKTVEALVELSDYEWKSINAATPKVKDVYSKTYDLLVDPKLYKMDTDKQKEEVAKLYNTLSEAEKKELEELKDRTMKKANELGIINLVGLLNR
ncbi:hypothetical protein ANCCAN_16623 [Ancylostoma caninum]|uniref:SXP/RAL-2 family protein Ani s 5-like cation-binding domain-containing protein n=1 Tax=Ancylostoma caninum TaxID=29170 RepID=A0A368G4B3_ANCCA|nr:hypothetical protein ANCCAN_16623 [Ancylostoma caninum]